MLGALYTAYYNQPPDGSLDKVRIGKRNGRTLDNIFCNCSRKHLSRDGNFLLTLQHFRTLKLRFMFQAAAELPKISSYGWDQSDKFISIYVDVDSEYSFDLTHFEERKCAVVLNVNGTKTSLAIHNLCQAINPDKSKIKLKPNKFVIKLKKAELGNTWSDLTDAKDLQEAARKKRVGGKLKDASTQELLADMYANATDEERAGLMEAAQTGQKKREQKR